MAAELTVEVDGSPIAAVVEAGVVLEGGTLGVTFDLVNTGDATLTIAGVNVPASVTVTTDPTDEEVEPEASTPFVVSLATDVIGERIVAVQIASDDPASPANFDVRWEVAPDISHADLLAIRRFVAHHGIGREIAETMEAGGGSLSPNAKVAIRVACAKKRVGNNIIAAIEEGTDLTAESRRVLGISLASTQRAERMADDLDSNPED